jgi:hypothetical protein
MSYYRNILYTQRYEPAYLFEHCKKEYSWQPGGIHGCPHEKDAREIDEFEAPISNYQ